jgi:hypothetical protein
VRLKDNGTNNPLAHQSNSFPSAEQLRNTERQHHGQPQVPVALLAHSWKQGPGRGLNAVAKNGPSHTIAALSLANSDFGLQTFDQEHPRPHQLKLDRTPFEYLANLEIKIDYKARYSFL